MSMTAETIHKCSYACERPECIRAQRDELASRVTAPTPAAARGDVRGLGQPVVAGALFDFLGFLTTLDNPVRLGATCEATVAVKLLSAWAAKRSLSLDEAAVKGWREALAAEGVQAEEVEQRARELLAAELRADLRPGAAEEAESGKLDHDPAMRAIVAALSQQPEARGVVDGLQRWSMSRGSDGARWSVYMYQDPAGEWVKWTDVQQRIFAAALTGERNG